MEKLLQWSIAQTTGDEDARKRVGEPDPELIQQLFGKLQDDPTLMKQNMFIIESDELDLENKIIACENFEMLIENLDNAMNIENLKLWEKLISQLSNPELSSYIASIIGTALQNNDKSQLDFLKYENGLSELIKLSLSDDTSRDLRLKSIYALSCLLRHNQNLFNKFDEDINNYDIILKNLNTTNDDKVILRSLSLLSAILSTGLNESKRNFLNDGKLINELFALLKDEEAKNINIKDKVLNILAHDLISAGFKFSKTEKEELSLIFEKLDKSQLNEDDYDIIKQVL